MDISLIVIGKTKIGYVRDGIDDYLRRLKHYLPYQILELPDLKQTRGLSEAQQKEMEGKKVLERLQPGDIVILLDERGKEYTSVEFSEYLNRQMATGRKRLLFVIGGPYGFSDEMYARADGKISLSRMTLNHEMVRMVFTEQVYRAMTILRGEPYHHE